MQSTNMRQTAAKFKAMIFGWQICRTAQYPQSPCFSCLLIPQWPMQLRAGQIEKLSLNSHEIVRALRYFSAPSAEKIRPCPGASVVHVDVPSA